MIGVNDYFLKVLINFQAAKINHKVQKRLILKTENQAPCVFDSVLGEAPLWGESTRLTIIKDGASPGS